VAAVQGAYAGHADLLESVASAAEARDGDLAAFREALAYLIDSVHQLVEAPPAPAAAPAAVGDLAAILGSGE
jgi:hypothetical protein